MKRFNEKHLTVIDFIRHGHCEGGEIYRGSTDVELSSQGREQMLNALHHASNQASDRPWQKIVTSPLKRCRLISEELAEQWQVPIAVEESFREMSFGDWEGKPVAQIHEQQQEQVKQFYRNPVGNTPPNGEPIVDVQARMQNAFEQILQNHLDQHLLLVQHGVSIRVMLLTLLNIPLNQLATLEIPYAGMARVKIYTGENNHRAVLSGLNRFSEI